MCGIFGAISSSIVNVKDIRILLAHSKQRGKDSSGLIRLSDDIYNVHRADFDIERLIKGVDLTNCKVVLGHSRLITNGLTDNQPVVRNDIAVLHNGIIVNTESVWDELKSTPNLEIDSEVIIGVAEQFLKSGAELENLTKEILSRCKGQISAAMLIPKQGKLLLFSNNGSLYIGYKDDTFFFASESYGLRLIEAENITQIKNDYIILDIPQSSSEFVISDQKERLINLIPEFVHNKTQEGLLEYRSHSIKRCTKCILPETMPFISFNDEGICNYCTSYQLRNVPKPKSELLDLLKPYRRPGSELDCIVPFSGGRDSCYGLHLIVNELGLKPITYTYDWGMVTDLGRRNISRMSSILGVENIIVAADISTKRRNIRMNLEAWLKAPNLGMMALLTAGDKHFFRHVEDIKKQTGINLNLWGVNPLEVTHFKTGFLDIKPDFEEKKVYSHGVFNQMRYHLKRFLAMTDSPGYFNSSLWDTLSGEYYRSFTDKKDYFHLFDFWRWDENEVNNTLLDVYGWEKAIDTTTTWRIGDGTAAFYNYVYYTVAGFTEHDTFRSNQIREGQLTREEALSLVKIENMPRYQNIRWYLDAVGLDYERVIKTVNLIPKLSIELI